MFRVRLHRNRLHRDRSHRVRPYCDRLHRNRLHRDRLHRNRLHSFTDMLLPEDGLALFDIWKVDFYGRHAKTAAESMAEAYNSRNAMQEQRRKAWRKRVIVEMPCKNSGGKHGGNV